MSISESVLLAHRGFCMRLCQVGFEDRDLYPVHELERPVFRESPTSKCACPCIRHSQPGVHLCRGVKVVLHNLCTFGPTCQVSLGQVKQCYESVRGVVAWCC